MSIFKCKMCGGTIEFEPGTTVGVCEYCGTKQTLPRLDDDKRTNLYDRANHFRRSNDFDKAMGLYEQILNEDSTDAEAYWSLVLCRYGIEYVEDPVSHNRVPTVNRAQFTSIFADEDYKSALQYADAAQRAVYEEEAKAIDDIQKGILAISSQEEPFDVFICYKETDSNGKRTQDSVLANDLYHQLTQEGFKVFFARITLEDKLGSAYEPYIFAALNSAKVMVALGTKPEHFNAVWVKNEWSRYLALIKKDPKKMLIPAYKDMDPYDLPEEFSHLQSQDMSKLGFMQDLIRGIKKITDADTPKAAAKETVIVNGSGAAVESLLKRAFMFLEDGNWQEADSYCERVLDQDPENARAYLGKLMAELQISTQEKIPMCKKYFEEKNNYKKALQFADELLASELKTYPLERDYNKVCERMLHAEEAEEKSTNSHDYSNSADLFTKASEAFGELEAYKDAAELQAQCIGKATALRLLAEQKAEEERIEAERKQEEEKIAAEKIKKKVKRLAPIVCACIALIIVLTTVIIPRIKYNAYVEKFGLEFVEKVSRGEIGEKLTFGSYNDQPIQWIVIDKDGSSLLLLSDEILWETSYHHTYEGYVKWENSDCRTTLNGDFFEYAFSATEQSVIQAKQLKTGNSMTEDKVFLLSYDETENLDRDTILERGRAWWLRSHLWRDERENEYIDFSGGWDSAYLTAQLGIRPAIWIRLK